MAEKLPDVCERVSSSTVTHMALDGALAHPYREFRDVLAVGDLCQYELIYAPRSGLNAQVVEAGVATYTAGNELKRVAPLRSVEDDAPYTFDEPSSEDIPTATYFVRMKPRDDDGKANVPSAPHLENA